MDTISLVIVLILVFLAVLLFLEMRRSRNTNSDNFAETSANLDRKLSANEANATSTGRLRAQEALNSETPLTLTTEKPDSITSHDEDCPLPDPFK